MRPEQDEPGRDAQAALATLVQCLVVMAGADRRLTLSEVEVVSALYAEQSGRAADHEVVSEVFARLKDADPQAALSGLREAGSRLEEEMKDVIIRACHRVMVADRVIDDRERARLNDIAGALGLSDSRVARLIGEGRS